MARVRQPLHQDSGDPLTKNHMGHEQRAQDDGKSIILPEGVPRIAPDAMAQQSLVVARQQIPFGCLPGLPVPVQRNQVRQVLGGEAGAVELPVDDQRPVLLRVMREQHVGEVGVAVDEGEVPGRGYPLPQCGQRGEGSLIHAALRRAETVAR